MAPVSFWPARSGLPEPWPWTLLVLPWQAESPPRRARSPTQAEGRILPRRQVPRVVVLQATAASNAQHRGAPPELPRPLPAMSA